MTNTTLRTTWDGKPIDPEPPFGASIIVYRQREGQREFLILHRAHKGPDYEGDWAWTPPSGARYPGEPIEECAARELHEEVGLRLPLQTTRFGRNWAVFYAEIGDQDQVELIDVEHDRYEWVPLIEAVRRCQPIQVSQAISDVASIL
ncbi:MAG: NUDIX domain-containing protein [Chloroflexota bacterium]